ncbi:AraC family transcriptional regulator [Alcaligenaceae bacterium A4P071]|nr:AraC family transcriptional regulator [Alcaligenaceae bacterium A4P071]
MDPTPEFWRDPAMPYAESRRACHSRTCYKPHSHPTYSIGAVDHGTSRFTGTNDGPVTLQSGAVVFVPATRVHACNPMPGSAWSYQMLHLDAEWLSNVRREYAPMQTPMQPECAATDPIRIVTEPAVYARFCRLNTLLFSHADADDKEAALIEFIGECDEAQGLHIDVPAAPDRAQRQIMPVLDLLRRNQACDTSLTELARTAGVSRYRLIRVFRAATGMTPHAWILNRRVNLARERIRSGADIAGVAHDLGFADQAHFQRVFKAHTGITPGGFRR